MSKQPAESSEQRPANLTALKQELAEVASQVTSKRSITIRPCRQVDFEAMYEIVNDVAEAYRT